MAPVKSGTLSANLSSDPGDQGFDGRRPRQTGVVGQYRLFISPTTAAVKRGQRDTQSRHGIGRKRKNIPPTRFSLKRSSRHDSTPETRQATYGLLVMRCSLKNLLGEVLHIRLLSSSCRVVNHLIQPVVGDLWINRRKNPTEVTHQ